MCKFEEFREALRDQHYGSRHDCLWTLPSTTKLAKIMAADPYFFTQDNGAGAPIHFATTYRQLDMLHHLLNCGAEVNQRDSRGLTPLHRAAYLAHLDGYIEIYEYLLSRGADPSICSEDYEPYLNPGRKVPADMVADDVQTRQALLGLEAKYAHVQKVRCPHPDIGDWWALYDYGLKAIKAWPADYEHPYPEVLKRQKERAAHQLAKQKRRALKSEFLTSYKTSGAQAALAMLQSASSQQAVSQTVKVASGGINTPPGTPSSSSSSSHTAFLFPGQGSQAVGMLRESKELPAVKEMLVKANGILGFDLLEVCLNGPKEKLERTEYSQPALFVAGLAAVEVLKATGPEGASAVDRCTVTAGLSLGEYCALVFAGAMSFEDGLKVVKVRSQSMAAAAATGEPHGMLSVVGLPDSDLQRLCSDALKKSPPGTVCQIANFLFPQGRVVSGNTSALEIVAQAATALGALKTSMLAVAGAFHTGLMASASEALKQALREVSINPTRIPVLSNVTAQPFPATTEGVLELLSRQLVEPVRWEASLKAVLALGSPSLYELGPGQQIKAMIRRIDTEAWKSFKNIAP
ncbi:hypothetical protein CEUSTIGMA_g13453.t1 [Chlamydomonas eustigma]|uniref:Malonyl-CoA:ACP transacylase (MAT) domain-containing protein n=1 Tax=Chlamydomonas eustigma TaxID=1157962 RepID=A0A250XSJ9_9CHLO|nr:hypothetical protein CEUSTIGMA_g13453.t1 [Chlamydomonas eustigma]|eukprot:GAX86038.1 hypothetical protein CEUSTIGMA_g13453.t1 [Chlamydomonas eustigma]